jgi:2',3'-cyclic-nucleotide 2'-phosphodiesterase/3'-nucleotidase
MRRFVVPVTLVVLALAGRPAAPHAEEARVTLLHTTDVHGALTARDELADRPALRGLSLAATLVARARREGQPVLLLDDGDALSGSPLAAIWHRDHAGAPEPVTMTMNAMGYDAMAVGNHEFDFGLAALDSARAAARFPFLAANVVRADGRPAFQATLVRQLPNGVKVGVLGLCTPAVPALADSAQWAGVTFLPPIEVAQREVARLRSLEHCDVVVVLAHTGLEKDPRTGEARRGDVPGENFGWRLADEVHGIDVVVLGHTHTVVPSAEVGGALVTQAGKWAEGLGRVDLTLTRASAGAPWSVASRRAQVIALADSLPVDAGLSGPLAPYEARTTAALDEVVGQAGEDLAAPGGRFADNALWQIVHRAQLAATGADVSLAAMFDPAQRIRAGSIRLRDVMRLYPYDNSLVTVRLTGAELRGALEQSARYLAAYTFEDGRPLAETGMAGYNFDMAMGVQYDVDLTRPPGERIQSLTRDGHPVRSGDTLRVVVNGYRAAGGGDFSMIRNAPRVGRAVPSAPAAVAAFLRAAGTLRAAVTPSWTLLPDYAAGPQRALIDRLVRAGVAPRGEVMHVLPDEPARRVDLAYWLGRAFDWRSQRPSGAFGDVPDSLEVWLDGILAKGVLGAEGRRDRFDPFRTAGVRTAIDWAERSARLAGYALAARKGDDLAFERGLVAGLELAGAPGRGDIPFEAPLTRGQWLGMLSNLRFPQLRVLETTDFHGAILGGAKDRRSGRAIGGTPALAAAIEHWRGENPEGTVLLDGGDIFQGTMISNLQFGRPVVEQMDLLAYAAAAIGNHDFDWSADTLRNRVMGMRFAALGANIAERRSGRRPWWVRSDTTFARRGVRVSVFGLAYPGTPRVTLPMNVAHLRFADDSLTAAGIVPRLRRAGADVVIGVGHIPAETDSTRRARGDIARLAGGVTGVDAWLGGHSHNVVDDRIHDAPVMIAGSSGQWLAMADLVVDPLRHRVIERRQRMMQVVADEFPVDTAWTGRVKRWNEGVAPIAAEVIGRSTAALTRGRPEATIGDFICDAMRFQSGADIAMQNPGGMRADLPAGPVTRGAIYEVMPFDNTIVTLSLSGADVRRALEQSLGYDRITQVSGIRYAFDGSLPPMGRVTSLTLADGSPLDATRIYTVAVSNFMAGGGDNYDALRRNGRPDDSGPLIRGAMEAFVRDRCKGGGALEIREDGRVRRAGR